MRHQLKLVPDSGSAEVDKSTCPHTLASMLPHDLPRLPPRKPESHKGDFGRALLVGGSRGMSGAVALSGMAALRGGAGLVKLAVPDVCLETVAQFNPCYMTVPLECDDAGRLASTALDQIQQLATQASCVAIGPGLGQSAALTKLVGWLYRMLPAPLVIDADGLNALATSPDGLQRPGGPRILTPHPGEFARLAAQAQLPQAQDLASRERSAVSLAGAHGLVIVLKGHHTLVTDGEEEFRNTTGNPGMATGGTGDVLTGLITALVCQGLSPLEAAHLGVFAHGLAGDLAADALGQTALTALDVIAHLPAALRACEGGP